MRCANDVGASRHHLLRGGDRALLRLGTDYIDLLQLHHFDAQTPLDSVMSTLDDLVRSGKVLYIGASNFSGWQLMKSHAVADRSADFKSGDLHCVCLTAPWLL